MSERAEADGEEVTGPAVRERPVARRRWLRWLARGALAGLGGLALLLVGAVWFVETDAARGLAVDLARDAGVELDYDRLTFEPIGGRLALDGLRLAMPARFAAIAPSWLTVARVELSWSPSALAAGRLHVERAHVEGVALLLVADEETDALSLWLEGLGLDDAEAEPAAPLSHALAELALPMALRVDSLSVREVRVEHVALGADGAEERASLEGLELSGALRDEGGRLAAELRLRSPARAEGTRVRFTAGETALEADLDVSIDAAVREAREVELSAAVALTRQTFEEALPLAGPIARLGATARFVPERGEVELALTELDLFDGIGAAHLALALPDGAALPRLEGGGASVRIDALAARLPSVLGIAARDAHLDLEIAPLPAGAPEGASRLALRVRAGELRRDTGAEAIELTGLALALDAELDPERVTARLRAPVERVRARAEAGAVVLEGVALALDVRDVGLADALAGRPWWRATGAIEAALDVRRIQADDGDAMAVEVLGARAALAASLEGRARWTPSATLTTGAVHAALDATTRVTLAPLALSARARDATLDLAQPMRVEAELGAPRLEVQTTARERLALDAPRVTVRATVRSPERFDVRADVRARAFDASAPGRSLTLRELALELGLDEVELDLDDPLASRARIALRAGGRRLDAHEGPRHLATDSLGATVRGRWRGGEPSSFTASVPLGAVRIAEDRGAPRTLLAPGTLELTVSELALDARALARSRVALSARGRFAPLTLEASARLAGGAGEVSVHASATPLHALLAALLGPSGVPGGVDLHRSGLELTLRGTYRGLDTDAPVLDHQLRGDLRALELRHPGVEVALPHAGLTVTHHGAGDAHRLELRASFDRLAIDGETLSRPITIEATARGDLAAHDAHVEATLGGPGALRGQLVLDARAPAGGDLQISERVTLSGLGAVAGLIPTRIRDAHPVDHDALALEVTGEGTLVGFLAPDRSGPSQAWDGAFRHRGEATLRGVRYHPEGLTIAAPEVRLTLDSSGDDDHLFAEATLRVPRLDYEDATHHVVVHDGLQRLHVRTEGELTHGGRVVVETDGRLARVEQDFLPAYPMEDVSLEARLCVDALDSLELERLVLDNPRGGTRLELSKRLARSRAVDTESASGERRRVRGGQYVSLRGQLVQDLARIDGSPETLRARGRLVAPFSADSGDGSLFRVHATVRLEDVDVALPELGLAVEGVRASVPVEEALEWTAEGGFAVVPNTERNPFARVRFQDVQAFMREDSHVEVRRVRWRDLELGPIAGSLEVDRNVFIVRSVRVERGPALITGQLVVDYLPGAERLQFRGNVTGLRTEGSDDPLDANAAIVFDPARLEVDGRVQIVRIGGAHLRELLDMLDPFRENPSLNTLRTTLDFGYPERVRLGLSRGLMSMHVELGGPLGSLLQIGEIRGIALGPFMTRHVAPYLPWED
ncbi:MAG: hypothetical protein KF729_10170 [Sandaracinaceae bacterium]|nr:hypothetical protein [Sandaracinaceae bacterium]